MSAVTPAGNGSPPPEAPVPAVDPDDRDVGSWRAALGISLVGGLLLVVVSLAFAVRGRNVGTRQTNERWLRGQLETAAGELEISLAAGDRRRTEAAVRALAARDGIAEAILLRRVRRARAGAGRTKAGPAAVTTVPFLRRFELVAHSNRKIRSGPLRGDGAVLPARTAKRVYDRASGLLARRGPRISWLGPERTDRARLRGGIALAGGAVPGAVLLVRAAARVSLPPAPWRMLLWIFLLAFLPPLLVRIFAKRWSFPAVGVGLLFTAVFGWLFGGGIAYWAGRAPEIPSWGEVIAAGAQNLGDSATATVVWLVTLLIVLALPWAAQRGTFRRAWAALRANRVAYLYILPAALGMLVLVLVPFAVGLGLGFFNHCEGRYEFVGLSNFVEILSGGGSPLSDPLNFWFTLAVTLGWTALNVFLHVAIGLGLALILRDPLLKGRGVYRVLLILPWAIPNYITALMWKGMFHQQFGAVNQVLDLFGLAGVSWFSSFWAGFTANVVTNTWLGFPFMMVVSLGALQSIPRELYEAAEVDGAGRWFTFSRITLPLLRPALFPAIIIGSIWTFNMFNVIYLVSGGEPGGSTDILITEAYRWAFMRHERYGLAAAYATLIFVILLGYALITQRLTRGSTAGATGGGS